MLSGTDEVLVVGVLEELALDVELFGCVVVEFVVVAVDVELLFLCM